MDLWVIFFIAISLSMDSLAVSVSDGIAVGNINRKDIFEIAGMFGFFQFLMPILGWILGTSVKVYIETIGHWIAFGILFLIGESMIKEAFCKKCEENEDVNISFGRLTVQAVATSIDALVVGISFAVLDVNIIYSSLIIGIVCFCISVFGCKVGKKIGNILKEKAQIVGGIVLIGIGVKILIENIFL